MNLFQRAYHGLSLTPGERAALKLVQQIAFAAGGAILAAILSYAASLQGLVTAGQYGQAVQLVAFVAGTAVCASLHKYLTALNDPKLAPIAAAASAYGTLFQADAAHLGANAPKVPLVLPTDATLVDASPAVTPAVPADSPSQPAPVAASVPA